MSSMRRLAFTTIVALAPLGAQDPLVVPAFTAYATPEPNSCKRNDGGGVPAWQGQLEWHGRVNRPGELHIALRLLPSARIARLRLQVGEVSHECEVTAGMELAVFEPFSVEKGYVTLRLSCAAGSPPGIASLEFSGVPARGAHFAAVERRNCASVHLGYALPEELQQKGAAWFYCECTPKADPLWTYYMATGWHRGYFGMQVNSATERRIIFSVWDSGNEAKDREKVADADRVQLLQKGEGVHASGFGNEGTGGHSHKVVEWQLGDTFCFLVHAEPCGKHTNYTGYYATEPGGEWQLVASFRAPKDGGGLRGLYSFNENFSGANGQLRRECEFGNQWVRSASGEWQRLVNARFTHDGHGELMRLDRFGSVRGDRFVLTTGGFAEPPVGGNGKEIVVEGGGRLTRAPGDGREPRDVR